MSVYWEAERVDFVDNLNLGAGAETVVFAPGRPIDVKRIILVMTAAQATAGAVVTVGVRNVDDSSSVTLGTFTTPAVMAINSIFYVMLDKPSTTGTTSPIDGSLVFDSDGGLVEVNPGQELFLASGGEGDTGAANVYVQYQEQGFQAGYRPAVATEITFVSA